MIGGVCVLPVTSGTEATHTLSSYGISSNKAMSSIFQLLPATSLNKFIVELFSDGNISMLSSKQGPIIPKRIYKSKQAFSNYFKIEWIMSLLGIMISIGYQSEMGWEKYARKKEGILYYPASIFLSRHSIQESAISIYFITTRYRSTTVINFDDVQYSDMNMLWKNQYPTKNDMGKNADIFRWHFSATKKQRCNIDDDATVIAATAYACADTKHYKNPDDQAKPGIAHTVFASINKANRKSEEEPKQLP